MGKKSKGVDAISQITVWASEEDYVRTFANDYVPPWFGPPKEWTAYVPGESISVAMMIGGDMLGKRVTWDSQDGQGRNFLHRVPSDVFRCIVPATSISFRIDDEGEDLGVHIQAVDGSVLRLGAVIRQIEGTASLIAAPANPRIALFASWMPLILGDTDWLAWMRHDTHREVVKYLIKGFPDEDLQIGYSPLTARFVKTCRQTHAAACA